MPTFFQKFKNFVIAHKIISAICALIIIFVLYKWHQAATSSGSIQYLTEAAQNGTITVSVTGSGQVSDQNKIDIKPQGSTQNSGALVAVDVKQAQFVKAGQIIAVVDEKNALLTLNQARASLASAQANYDKILAGATPQDLAVSLVSVDSAKLALNNAKTSYQNVVNSQNQAVSQAFLNYLNAGLGATANFSDSSAATLAITGSYNGSSQGVYNLSSTNTSSGAYLSFSGIESGSQPINRGVPIPIGTMGLYATFSSTGTIYAGESWTINLPNTSSSSYLTAYNAYQNALQTQTTSLSNAQAAVDSATIALEQAQANYNLKAEPPANADVEAAKATLQNAQTQLQSVQLAYDENIIKAPFDGVIAQLNSQQGDEVTSSTIIATIITQQKLATIPLNEVDVAKVQLGQKVNLNFDAIDGLTITGEIAQIDSIATVTQGVVTYNVKINFDTQDDRIKSGMSVNATIITDVKTDVLMVPNSAIKTNSSGTYVQVLDSNGQPQNQIVQTGISNDQDTEITSGIQAGDNVVTQTINTGAQSSTTTRSSGSIIPGLGGGNRGAGGGGGTVRFGGGG